MIFLYIQWKLLQVQILSPHNHPLHKVLVHIKSTHIHKSSYEPKSNGRTPVWHCRKPSSTKHCSDDDNKKRQHSSRPPVRTPVSGFHLFMWNTHTHTHPLVYNPNRAHVVIHLSTHRTRLSTRHPPGQKAPDAALSQMSHRPPHRNSGGTPHWTCIAGVRALLQRKWNSRGRCVCACVCVNPYIAFRRFTRKAHSRVDSISRTHRAHVKQSRSKNVTPNACGACSFCQTNVGISASNLHIIFALDVAHHAHTELCKRIFRLCSLFVFNGG